MIKVLICGSGELGKELTLELQKFLVNQIIIDDNFDDLTIPPKDTYPAQVRSDIKDYLRNIDHLIVIILSGISSIVFFGVPFKSYIILASIIGLAGAMVLIKIKK